MSSPDTLKEFLIRVGFKVDDATLSKYQNTLEDITKKTAALATILGGAAVAVGLSVQKFANHMEQLHFASQRTNTTVRGLKSVEYAARQLGATSEGALSAVEGISRFMRDKPGGEAWLSGFVDTRDATGKLRDTTEILMDLGDVMNNLPYQAKGIGDMLGLDEATRLAIQSEAFRKYFREREALGGADAEAAKKAHEFEKKLRALQERFDQLAVTVGDKLLNTMGPALERFAAWIEKNGDLLANRLASGMDTVLRLGQALAPALGELADLFIRLDKATDGWSTKLLAAGVALKAVGLGGVVTGTAAAGAKAAGAAGGLFSRFLGALGLAGYSSSLNDGEDAIVAKMRAGWGKSWSGAPEGPASGAIGNGRAAAGKRSPLADKLQAAVEFFERNGWTRAQAAGIVSNIKNESSFDPIATNQGHYGLAQWDANRQANFKKWSGRDIHGSSAEDQMRFIHYELTQGLERAAGNALRMTTHPGAAADAMFRLYERAGDSTGPRRARDAVQIAQNVSINVSGGGSPGAIGRAVAGEQSNQSNELALLLQGVIDARPAY